MGFPSDIDAAVRGIPAVWTGLGGFLIGAMIGSYLATILFRWPAGRSAIAGRSRCDTCERPLRPSELIPLLSYSLAKGRCRRCKAPIDVRHFAIELAAGMIGLISFIAHPGLTSLVTALFGWWLLIIAALDLEEQWLPDLLTLPLIAAGLILALFPAGPMLAERVIGAAVGYSALLLIAIAYRRLRRREGLGGGDPKLLAGLGAWLGWQNLPLVLLGAGLAGFASLLLLRLRGQAVSATDRLPLGTLMALAAWPIWLITAAP